MRANQPEAFQLLRTAIRLCRQHGSLLPSAEQCSRRFIAMTEGEIAPLVRHLAHVLRQEGFEAVETIELDGEMPYVAVHLKGPQISVMIWPQDALAINVSVERHDDGARAITLALSYDDLAGGGLMRAIQEWLIRALDPRAVPPLPPI